MNDLNIKKEILPLSQYVRRVVAGYFCALEGAMPRDLYNMVLSEVEKPLFEEVLEYVNGNQSKAARLLNMNRGTFRKKLKQYGL